MNSCTLELKNRIMKMVLMGREYGLLANHVRRPFLLRILQIFIRIDHFTSPKIGKPCEIIWSK